VAKVGLRSFVQISAQILLALPVSLLYWRFAKVFKGPLWTATLWRINRHGCQRLSVSACRSRRPHLQADGAIWTATVWLWAVQVSVVGAGPGLRELVPGIGARVGT
jgi:hypothetical protein